MGKKLFESTKRKNNTQLNDWNFSKQNQKLFKELNDINNSVEKTLHETFLKINEYDSSLLKYWTDEGLKPKIDSYLLRYVIPFYELLIQEKKKNIVDALVIQLLSCVSWRTFDNCIDTHEAAHKAQLNSLLTSFHLFDYSKSYTTEKILPALELHYKLMTEQTVIEKSKPIALNDIWKRCSIFLFAADEISQLSKSNVELYKHYINYSGLAHDTHDFFSDISGKVISLPVFWMKQLNPDEVLSINTVKLLYDKVRTEVKPLEKKFKSLQVEKKFPLMNHLLKESKRTFHDE